MMKCEPSAPTRHSARPIASAIVILVMLAYVLAGCDRPVAPTIAPTSAATLGGPMQGPAVPATPSPTALVSATLMALPTATRSSIPARPSATVLPASPTAAFSVVVSPTEQTIPAGASASFFLSAPQWKAPTPPAHWAAVNPGAGLTADLVPDAVPHNTTLVVNSSCTTPKGPQLVNVQAAISDTVQVVPVKLNIAAPITQTQPGTFTGTFKTGTIGVLRGGPSTYRYGPFLVLQFCASAAPRTLKVSITNATSDAGTALVTPPRVSLFRSLVWPVPDSLQTVAGGYRANAREVANGDGSTLQWNIEEGVYVLVFQRSPVEDSWPPEQRPASVAYRIDIIQ